jgi:hypothetical protein
LRIYNSDNEEGIGKISCLYMGDTHTAKSHYLSTWPHPLVIAFDPDTLTLRKMPGVYILEVESWSEFQTAVFPYIQKRALGKLVQDRLDLPEEPLIETLGIDTISIASEKLALHLQGNKERLTQADFGTFLTKLMEATLACIETTRQTVPNEPTYHCVFTSHMSIYGDEGQPQVVRPAIKGQFRELLPRLFGCSFLCEHGQRPGKPSAPGKPPELEEFWQIRTSPPDRRFAFGDRIGGGGKYNRLPATTAGDYASLMKAWGMPV